MGSWSVRSLSIRARVTLAMVGAAGVASLLLSAFAYVNAKQVLTDAQLDKLVTVREHKAAQIEDYMDTVVAQAEQLATSPEAVTAMRGLDREWDALPVGKSAPAEALTRYYSSTVIAKLPEGMAREAVDYLPGTPQGQRLQELYITDNPNAVGSKQLMDDAGDGSRYSQLHASVHPFFRGYLDRFGYYDAFLVELDKGEVVYSVFKETDYATSLMNGPHANSNLGRAFRAAAALPAGASVVMDFEPYEPSYGAPASFVAAPIFDGPDRIGVLILQMPLNRIASVMTNDQKWTEAGLGATGESYLIGPDLKARNDTRAFLEAPDDFYAALKGSPHAETLDEIKRTGTVVGQLKINTEGAQAALQGETGVGRYLDYHGEPAMGAYRPLDIAGLKWAIVSEIDEEEALAPVYAFRQLALAGLGMVALLTLGVAYFVGGALAGPIVLATARIRSLASGERATSPMDAGVGGELGQLAGAYNDLVLGMTDLADRAGRVARGEAAVSGGDHKAPTIANTGPLADAFGSMERTQQRLTHQATLIAAGDLRNPALDERIQGALGTAFSNMAGTLRMLAQQARAIAEGDLVADCLQTRLDGDLGESFERMVVSLRELVGEIQANAQSLNDTAAQLHEAALSQQLGASEQASAVEETRRILSTLSTSAKEIASATSAVYSNAEVAQQTNNQTAEAIRELSGHTARIGEIVSFIKDVANKSDLLALNAALEGTKAGDAGRSFSLVATQMQRLAEQIMGSLKDIDALTEDIRRATRSTVSAVEETSRLSTQTTQSAGAIAEAIQEQQVGTQQSTTAMDQISAVAQKSVSTSSDLVGASKQLQGLSTTFQRVVSHFHTTGISRAAPRTDRRAA